MHTHASHKPEPSVSLSEQIARLQERQLEMIQQTSSELEALRREADRQAAEQNESELLRTQLTELQAQREKDRQDMQAILDSLKQSVGGQLRGIHQQLRQLSLEALESLERTLDQVDTASLPEISPLPELPVTKLDQRVKPVKPIKAVVKKEPRVRKPLPKFPHKLLVRGLTFAALAGLIWFGWKHVNGAQAGQVAGVSTDPSITNPSPSAVATAAQTSEPDYKEAQVDLPFAQTTWSNFSDPDFGVSMDYPTNTSDLVHAADSDNLFLVRKDGYMFRVSKVETTETFASYMQEAQGDYGTDYSIAVGTFNGRTAYVGTSLTHDQYSGTMYFVPRPPSTVDPAPAGTTILYQVWVKDETAGSDDARRLDRIVNSFQFLNLS